MYNTQQTTILSIKFKGMQLIQLLRFKFSITDWDNEVCIFWKNSGAWLIFIKLTILSIASFISVRINFSVTKYICLGTQYLLCMPWLQIIWINKDAWRIAQNWVDQMTQTEFVRARGACQRKCPNFLSWYHSWLSYRPKCWLNDIYKALCEHELL